VAAYPFLMLDLHQLATTSFARRARVNPRNPRHPRSIRLDEYYFLYPDNHANNPALFLPCCNTCRKEDTDANLGIVF
jgi:hypothetical protein